MKSLVGFLLMCHDTSKHMEKVFSTRNRHPSPEGHGCVIEDGQIVLDWMQGLPAPQVVIELIACKCSRVCKAPECQCVANALK